MRLARTTSSDPDFVALVRDLDAEMWARYPDIQGDYVTFNVLSCDTVIVAYLDDQPAGCGAFKPCLDGVELKRMFVSPAARGAGVGRAIVGTLEAWAAELGHRVFYLEHGPRQPEAARLYAACGFQPIECYGVYAGMPNSICLRKTIG